MTPNDSGEERDEAQEAHERLVLPLLIPAVGFLFAVLAIYGLSRIYLELNTYKVGDVTMATPLAIGVSILILLGAAYFASQRRIYVFQLAGVFVVVASLLTAGGIWAAVHEESTGEEGVVATATPSGGETPVAPGGVSVSLEDPDWAVIANPTSVAAGEITFTATNDGTLAHNFHVIKTELAEGDLPVDPNTFQVDLTQVDSLGDTPNIPVGQQETLTLTLEPGAYVLICNIAAHYEAGMHTAFTVE